jgi:hypothetical protein
VFEGVDWDYDTNLLDVNGVGVPASAVSTLMLRIWVLNAAQTDIQTPISIFNADRGTYHPTTGALKVKFLPSDSNLVDVGVREEVHIALLTAELTNGRKWGREVEWLVRNIVKHP